MVIKKVVRNSEGDRVILILENNKQITRKLYKNSLTEVRYFKYNKCEYYLNKLHLENIQIIDDI